MAPPYVCKIVSLKVRNKKWALSKNCLKTCLITPMFVCLFVYLAVFVMLCVLSCLSWRLAYMAKCLADKINFRCPFIGKPFICYPLPRGIETAQSSRARKRILNGVLLQEQTKVLIFSPTLISISHSLSMEFRPAGFWRKLTRVLACMTSTWQQMFSLRLFDHSLEWQ